MPLQIISLLFHKRQENTEPCYISILIYSSYIPIDVTSNRKKYIKYTKVFEIEVGFFFLSFKK